MWACCDWKYGACVAGSGWSDEGCLLVGSEGVLDWTRLSIGDERFLCYSICCDLDDSSLVRLLYSSV